MKHKFKAVNKSKLDSPKRREALPILKIIAEAGIEKSVNIADIGCGIGYFTFPLAEAVGEEGLVYAIDVETEMLADIINKMGENHIKNVIPVISQEYDLKLEDHSVKYAFLCTVLHEVNMREKFLKEVNRILAANGEVIIIEWVKKETDYGPPKDHRLEESIIRRNLQRAGFNQSKIIDLNEYFYMIKAVKK
ncbi:MAG: methyltransferase domain-containing protein [Lachnospiraceae bacterium]